MKNSGKGRSTGRKIARAIGWAYVFLVSGVVLWISIIDANRRCEVNGCDRIRCEGSSLCSIHKQYYWTSSKYYRDSMKKTAHSSSSASSAYKGTSKKSSYRSSGYRDPDDHMDVEGYYYDNRSDFESEDDAWDYLEDDWDDWD